VIVVHMLQYALLNKLSTLLMSATLCLVIIQVTFLAVFHC